MITMASLIPALSNDEHDELRPIALVVDLCLYRAVIEQCGGRVLP